MIFEDCDGTPRAVGMELYRGEKMVRVRARKEVLLSCGAVMSPVVLMNSGVGPKVCIYVVYIPIWSWQGI